MSDPVGVVTGGLPGTNEISISQLLSNSTDFPATLTYTVTPTVGTDGCEGNPFDVVVTVNPTVGIDVYLVKSYVMVKILLTLISLQF